MSPVDERHSGLDVVDDARSRRCELDDVAVLGDQDRGGRDPGLLREPAVRREHPELAVDRHHRLRAEQAEQRPQLLRAGVAGDVDRRILLVQHLGPVARQAVDGVVHAQLVPGHRAGGDDDGVAPLDLDGRVVVVRDPRQRRERLAL
jgi:hypothetical protein